MKRQRVYTRKPLRAYLREALKNAPLRHFPNLNMGRTPPEAIDLADIGQDHEAKERFSTKPTTIILDLTCFEIENGHTKENNTRNDSSEGSNELAAASDTMSATDDDEADRIVLWNVFADMESRT